MYYLLRPGNSPSLIQIIGFKVADFSHNPFSCEGIANGNPVDKIVLSAFLPVDRLSSLSFGLPQPRTAKKMKLQARIVLICLKVDFQFITKLLLIPKFGQIFVQISGFRIMSLKRRFRSS